MTARGTGGDEGSKRQAPFSLRLSFEERARLEDLAGEMSLSAFIKEHLFQAQMPRKRRRRRPAKDSKLLAQLLAVMGKSRLPQNMNQLAKAAHTGTLPLPVEVERELRQACADIRAMREMLMQGLGLKVKDQRAKGKESLSHAFTKAATDISDIGMPYPRHTL